ncbi:MAG: hypothetical protein ACF788_02275, partial [Novipirellula sp. JB048]
MGGVPVLLLLTAIGVNYGWQPDEGGGVEYIIQIPAEQVERLQDTGEITSVIDPQVQGHVSRVVIRVGDQPLPRKTPPHVAQLRHEVPLAAAPEVAGDGVASSSAPPRSEIVETQARPPSTFDAADQNPIPIPQMTEHSGAQPIPGLNPTDNQLAANPAGGPVQTESMMKPDASNPATGGPGFHFPNSALPQSLQEAAGATATRAREGLSTAVQELGNRASNEIDAAIDRTGQGAEQAAAGLVERARDALRSEEHT